MLIVQVNLHRIGKHVLVLTRCRNACEDLLSNYHSNPSSSTALVRTLISSLCTFVWGSLISVRSFDIFMGLHPHSSLRCRYGHSGLIVLRRAKGNYIVGSRGRVNASFCKVHWQGWLRQMRGPQALSKWELVSWTPMEASSWAPLLLPWLSSSVRRSRSFLKGLVSRALCLHSEGSPSHLALSPLDRSESKGQCLFPAAFWWEKVDNSFRRCVLPAGTYRR